MLKILQNIFVFRKPPEDPGWRVKLGDFGVSKRVRDASITSWHTSIVGDCSAPEVFGLLAGDYTEETSYADPVDMWSLGYVAHWLMTNRYPLTKFALARYCRQMDPIPLSELADNGASDSAMNFVEALLHLDPASRMTASETLRHPFLAIRGNRDVSSSERFGSSPHHLQTTMPNTLDIPNRPSHGYGLPPDVQARMWAINAGPNPTLRSLPRRTVPYPDFSHQTAHFPGRTDRPEVKLPGTLHRPSEIDVEGVALTSQHSALSQNDELGLCRMVPPSKGRHTREQKDPDATDARAEEIFDSFKLTADQMGTRLQVKPDMMELMKADWAAEWEGPKDVMTTDDLPSWAENLAATTNFYERESAETREVDFKLETLEEAGMKKDSSCPKKSNPERATATVGDINCQWDVDAEAKHLATGRPPRAVQKESINKLEGVKAKENLRLEDRMRHRGLDLCIKKRELQRFATNFQLPTPVPEDLVHILAKDPAKRQAIIDSNRVRTRTN